MRVLALGAFDVPYIRDTWGDALRHVLGPDVTCVNVSSWLAAAPPEAHAKAVYRLLSTGAYDYLFFYHDYIFADFSDDFFAHVRASGVKTVAYHPDDEPEVWYQRNRPFDGRYDLVASHAQRGVQRRLDEARPTEPLYLPWGFNPRFFNRALERTAPRYDVLFIGKCKVHDHDPRSFREDGARRDQMLKAAAALCERRGWRFGLFGYGWDRHPELGRFAGGVLSHDEMVRAYHQSRIVLNAGWTADEGESVPQTKLRHFEVPGCGAFQLTNANPELAELFAPGREVAFYEGADQLCERIEHYLSHDEERSAIAEHGYIRAHREHTLDARVRSLVDHLASRWPPKRSGSRRRPMPRIATLSVATIDQVRALRRRLEVEPQRLTTWDAVHVAAANATAVDTNYAALRDWWRADVQVLAGRCFYRASNCQRNPLQPRRSEIVGGFLSECTAPGEIRVSHRERLTERLVSLTTDDRVHFLVNYIAKPSALPALLDAFLTGEVDRLDALDPLPTGLVLTEVLLDLPRLDPSKDGPPPPPYAEALQAVLRQAVALGQTVGIYGARGDMAEEALELVRATPGVQLVGLFDKAMAGRQVAGVPVYSAFELPSVAPEVLFIAAAYSGPAIYEQLKPLEPRMSLVPLYDLNAPAWAVLVPRTVERRSREGRAA